MWNTSKTFGQSWRRDGIFPAIYFYGLPAQAQPWYGSGEPNDPYIVYHSRTVRQTVIISLGLRWHIIHKNCLPSV